jgi:hypothetical protein
MMDNDYGEDKSFDSQTNADADAGESYHPGTEYDGDDETVLSVEEVVGEADAPEPSERASDTASESESDTFDPFAGMDESERPDTDARDPMNPFVNGLLDDGDDEEDEDEDTEADTGMTNVEVRDTTIGTHHGQPIKVGTERRSRAAVNANAPTDARVGGPDMTNDTPDDILDTDTEHVGVDVGEERMAGRQAEIEATHLRSMDDREERTREVVTEEISGGVEPVGREETTDAPSVPLGGLSDDVQAEAAKEAARMAERATWDGADALTFQWALGDHLRAQDGEKDVGQALLANTDLLERPPGWTTVEEVNADPDGGRTSIQGEVAQLWDNDDPDIAAVGLLADPDPESNETVKFTVFRSATKAGLTTHYSEPGFPSRHTRAVSANIQEGQTLHLEDVTQTWDDQGRPCIEVSKGGQKDVTTV